MDEGKSACVNGLKGQSRLHFKAHLNQASDLLPDILARRTHATFSTLSIVPGHKLHVNKSTSFSLGGEC
eukprot:1158276-Pelagomonas_calceolata.AAC.3